MQLDKPFYGRSVILTNLFCFDGSGVLFAEL